MIGATTPEASEYIGSGSSGAPSGPYLGAFAVTCGGGSAGDVTIDFSLGGSATPGVDYTLSSSATITYDYVAKTGTITIPGDGPETATIYVVPNDIFQVGGSKLVSMTLASGTGYNIVGGWSTANVTINEDDLPPTPWSGDTTPQITAFKPDGSQTDSASAPLGDFIPIEISIPSGVQSSALFTLDCPSGVSVSYTPDGQKFGLTGVEGGPRFAELGPGYGYYLMLYASATDPTTNQEAWGPINLECASGGANFPTTGANVDFKPLQMYNNALDNITSSTRTGLIGKVLDLQVRDLSGQGGLVTWSMPAGNTVKNYQPTTGTGANERAVAACAPNTLVIWTGARLR